MKSAKTVWRVLLWSLIRKSLYSHIVMKPNILSLMIKSDAIFTDARMTSGSDVNAKELRPT